LYGAHTKNEPACDFSFGESELALSTEIHEVSTVTGKKKSNTKKHGQEID
jgi:hypothetical protein